MSWVCVKLLYMYVYDEKACIYIYIYMRLLSQCCAQRLPILSERKPLGPVRLEPLP